MSKLHETYVECGKEQEIDLSTTKQTPKKKVVERFPGLHFLKHNQRNRSEIIYFHEMSPTKHTYNEPNESDNELQDLEFETEQSEAGFWQMHRGKCTSEAGFLANVQREIDMSALHLKNVQQTHSAPLTEVCPPYATDFTNEAA